MRTRRGVLARATAVGLAPVAGCLGARPSGRRDRTTARTGNRTNDDDSRTRTGSGTDGGKTVEATATEPYTIGPSRPNCPGHAENASERWGMMELTTKRVEGTADSPADALDLFTTHYDRFDDARALEPETDEIEWMGETHDVTADSVTGTWYVLEPETHLELTVVVVQESAKTVEFREYFVGDC